MWSNFLDFLKSFFPKAPDDETPEVELTEHQFIQDLRHFWQTWITPLLPPRVQQKEIHYLNQALKKDAEWNLNYVMFTVSACLIATFGLISNSTAVIIGAMLIAPLMLPLRALALSALEGDFFLFTKALTSILGGTLTALFLSWFVGTVVNIPEFGSEVLARTQPNLVDLGIAVTAGSISGFAKIRRGVSDALAGTAIAVALMPPLCVVGLSLSQGNFAYSTGAFLLYITNLLGITLACMLVFIIAGYTEPNHALGWTLSLILVLFIPLGLSFWQLIRQAQLKEIIKASLLNKTVTLGQGDINLQEIKINWTAQPPLIELNIQTQKEITPKQVWLVKNFVSRDMGQEFNVKFIVDRVDVVFPQNLDPLEELKPMPN
jgi:uncharacterized hydrophobic protein (TIGR00271 family)